MDETIAGWSQADLRRFIVNTILTDPGAYPKGLAQPGSLSQDGVPVWDGSRWVSQQITADQIENGAVGIKELATGIVLELLSAGSERKVAFGSGTVTYPGATQVAGATVTHGFSVSPFVWAVSQQTSGGSATSAYTASIGASTFVVNVYSPTGSPAGGTTAGFHWLAIA